MKLKPGVKLQTETGVRVQPECIIGMMAAQQACNDLNIPFVVTSVCEGKHSKHSLHYKGLAFDVRTRDMGFPRQLRDVLRNTLGSDWDCILEPSHLHCEYDPK